MSEELRRRIALAAEGFAGTPYQHQGRVPGTGLDCSGVVVCAAAAEGVEVEDVYAYGRSPNPRRFMEAVERSFVPIPRDAAGDGDVLVYWFLAPHVPQHLAVLTTVGGVQHAVHAYTQARRVVVVPRRSAGFVGREHSAWRYRGAV